MEKVGDGEKRALLTKNLGPLKPQGRPAGQPEGKGDNVTFTDRGNSASYLARVLVELREAEDRARDLRIRAQEVSDRVRRLREGATRGS